MATKPLQSITFPGLPDTYTVPSKAEDVGAAPLEYARQIGNPRNLLDNSDFRNPVNQRGFSSGSSVASWTYFIDRWRAYSGTATITLNDNGISCENYIDQPTNNLEMLVGKTVTCAVGYADGTVLCGSGVITNNGDWSAIVEAENANTKLCLYDTYVGLWSFVINGAINVIWAALYEGEYTAETLPKYQSKGYAAELLECQRYFINLGNSSFGFGFVSANGTSCGIIIPMPTKMRATPTVTVDNFRIKYRTLQKSVSNFAVTKINSSSILLTVTETFTVDSSGSGAPAIAFSNGMTLSADL